MMMARCENNSLGFDKHRYYWYNSVNTTPQGRGAKLAIILRPYVKKEEHSKNRFCGNTNLDCCNLSNNEGN